jgi:glycosyltransferase involved in cell wall biosynthesis
MISPKLSIITPSFNQGKFIRDTIESVLSQNYENFEHIIIDALSTDNTIGILKEYGHLKWISEKDNGPANALNKGFNIATGEILAWINSDDYYESNVFPSVASVFNSDPAVQFLCGDLTIIDEKGEILVKDKTHHFDKKYLTKTLSDVVRQPATFFTRSLLDKSGLLDESYKIVFDYELFVRMLCFTNPYFMSKNLAYYRSHDQSITNNNIRGQSLEIMKVSFIHGAKPWDKIILRNIKKFMFPAKYTTHKKK